MIHGGGGRGGEGRLVREENRYVVYSNSCGRKKEEGGVCTAWKYIYPSVGFCLNTR